MRLAVHDATVTIEQATILSDACLTVEAGEFVGLLGPNGSGKSTLLRTIYRALRPVCGTVHVGEDDVWEALSARASAQRTAVVAQEAIADFDFTVADVVAMGRNPHKGVFDRETDHDVGLCADALDRVGMSAFAERDFASLSGGEKQRVFVARAIAQETQVLVLDEPTNHLDIRFQLELLDLVRSLGVTVIAAMHDLGLAAGHCDRIYVLEAGRVVGAGSPREVLSAELVARVFGVRLCDWDDPQTGRTHMSFDRLPAHGGASANDPQTPVEAAS